MYRRKSAYEKYRDLWIEKYNNGMSFTAIGKEYGVHYSTVRNVIINFVDKRDKSPYKKYVAEWVRLYEIEGLSSNEIAKKYKCDVTTVTKMLKNEGVQLRRDVVRERTYDKYLDEWIELYDKGLSLKSIAEKYGTYPQTVHSYIKEKIEMRKYEETSKTYHLMESYFDVIDNKEKAYWLGYFYSSGNLAYIKEGAGYTLQLSDKIEYVDRLEKFRKVIKLDKNIEKLNPSSNVIRFTSKHMCQTLIELGFSKDKNNNSHFPKIEKDYYKSFILGFVDGKGYINSKRNQFAIHGSDHILKTIKNYTFNEIGVHFLWQNYKQYKKNTSDQIKITKKDDLLKFIDWLYKDEIEYSSQRDLRKIDN
ncbi:hypothetical protein [Metabacillus niabensis]|uniref:hypothetical protein n=1 Tax=Metabacillus niabensis TaxID=324854 RepID=UPI0039A1208D